MKNHLKFWAPHEALLHFPGGFWHEMKPLTLV